MLNSGHIAIDFYHKEGDLMKKLTYLLAVFAFLAALAGLAVALMGFFERKKAMLEDDDYEQELYHGGQEYYAEDFDLESPEEEAAPASEQQEEEKPAEE